jgi:translation initiation factor IF-3
VVTVKEVKVGSRTDMHDVDFKVSHIRRFLEKGQRVRMSVFFRGREIVHPELGKEMLEKMYEKVQDIAQTEGEPRLDGRKMSMMIVRR